MSNERLQELRRYVAEAIDYPSPFTDYERDELGHKRAEILAILEERQGLI